MAHPTRPPITIAPACAKGEGTASTPMVASTARVARYASGQSYRAMLHTACATTATATTFNPCKAPDPATSPNAVTPYPNKISAIADGMVKPIQAATAPGKPARESPTPMPTWLDAGPGKNWHNATRSA